MEAIVILAIFLGLFALIIAIVIIIKAKMSADKDNEEETEYSQKNLDLDLILTTLKADTESNLTIENRAYNFIPSEKNKFSTFSTIRFFVVAYNYIVIRAVWKKPIPYSLFIRSKNIDFQEFENTIFVPILSDFFQIYTDSSEIWLDFFEDKILRSVLQKFRKAINYIFLTEEDVEISIRNSSIFFSLLDLTSMIGREILEPDKDYDVFEVEKLRCYSCGDEFDPLEETCDKCGSFRPRCIVCYLDLSPSEKDNVVVLPCCGVYAHKHHIIDWLKQKPICPNCTEDIGDWLKLIT